MTAKRIAWTLYVFTLTVAASAPLLTWRLGYELNIAESVLMDIAYATIGLIGVLVISRHPRNAVGWMLLGISFLAMTSYLGGDFLSYLVVHRGITFPGMGLAATLSPLGWGISGGLIVLTLHLFPDGKPLSPRWAWVFRLGVFGLSSAALAVLTSLQMNVGTLRNEVWVDNPLGQLVGSTIHLAFEYAALTIVPVVLLTPVVIFLRYRRSREAERAQMKWLVYAAALLLVGLPILGSSLTALGIDAGGLLFLIGIILLPVSIGMAILKHRLYDIDVVISRSLVFAGLAGFITAIYVGIVVGVGSVLGAGGEPNLALSIVATAVVAVAFQPVRERLTKVANRLVFGKRATPYEVLSRFSSHLGDTVATEDTLARMAQLLADGTGAAHAQVSLSIGGQLVPAASVGEVDPTADVHTVEVTHQGETLGALSVTKERGETLTPADIKLVDDLAAQAGLLLRNVRLTEELKARIVDLRGSRQRLVAAQDAERRRLERDLHDGAQQQIVAMKLKLGIARTLAERAGAPETVEAVDRLIVGTDEAVATLRELAHGIYPPLLAADGLTAAITTAARRATVPVTVEADGVGRYGQDVEAAVYFCVLEALQNAARYSEASRVRVRLSDVDGTLSFEVSDDGIGFDPSTATRGHGTTNMVDRLDALGGELILTSGPTRGTTVIGRLPIAERETIN